MEPHKFTEKSLLAIENAHSKALSLKNTELSTLHLLNALITQKDGLVSRIFEKMKLDLENVIALVNEMNTDLKKLKNKDQVIIKQNNKIEKQHKKIFELFEENINPNSSGGYSYGD